MDSFPISTVLTFSIHFVSNLLNFLYQIISFYCFNAFRYFDIYFMILNCFVNVLVMHLDDQSFVNVLVLQCTWMTKVL